MTGKVAVLVAVLSLGVFTSACSSSSTTPPTTTTTTAPMTLADGCAQLTAIQTSGAGSAFGTQGFTFGAHPTLNNAKAYGFTARNLSDVLSSASWPSAAQSDVNALSKALSSLATQLYAYDGSAAMLTSVEAQSKEVGRVGNVLEKSMTCKSAF